MNYSLLAVSSLTICIVTNSCSNSAGIDNSGSIGGSLSGGANSSVNGGGGGAASSTDASTFSGGQSTAPSSQAGASSQTGASSQAGASSQCNGAPVLGTVDANALYAELAIMPKPFLLINVHTDATVNIPNTDANIDYTNVSAIESFIGANKSQSAVIYCMTSHMATIAGPQLVGDGYCHVRYLSGGLGAWQTAGYAVTPTP